MMIPVLNMSIKIESSVPHTSPIILTTCQFRHTSALKTVILRKIMYCSKIMARRMPRFAQPKFTKNHNGNAIIVLLLISCWKKIIENK
jgi:hypothetical protein